MAREWLNKGLWFVVAICAGFTIALVTFRLEWRVDYDSGAQMQVTWLGPFRVREELWSQDSFGGITIDGSNKGLTGVPNWHRAALFHMNSRRSPLFDGGKVLSQVRHIAFLIRCAEPSDRSAIKKSYLEALARGGPLEAQALIDQIEVTSRPPE